MWYTESMSDIVPFDPQQLDDLDPKVRRIIAEALGVQAEKEVLHYAVGKKLKYKDALAMMLWDLAVEGKMQFSSGTEMEITDPDEWMKVVRFLANHMDGPVQGNVQINANFFKVYQGIDTSQV